MDEPHLVRGGQRVHDVQPERERIFHVQWLSGAAVLRRQQPIPSVCPCRYSMTR